jgi:hypothetical protein
LSDGFDALDAVRAAVSIVCEVDATGLSAATAFDDLGVDSLARVSIADVVESSHLAATHRALHLDDATLGRMASLQELADFIAASA